ncbi:MAG: hypothetical protein R3F14_43660, partial [Polyangiaceae bacterium]
MSSSSPKRPSPPAPDPNWEDELHGPHGKPSRAAPDSKDELLAHAVLRIEPEPLDAIDDFGELDRVTLPPPTGMADHVARMMAEAAMLDDVEDFDNEGDRPTPLFELEPPPFPQRGVRQNEPTPRAPLPAMRDIPVRPLAPREPAPAPRGGPLRAPTPAPFRSPRGGPLRVPTPAPFATPLGGPLRSSTPEPFSAPPSSGPLRVPADEPFPSVRAREASGPPPSTRAPTPPQGRAPRASTTPIPGVPSRPTAQRPTTPAPPPPRARDRVPSSLDLEDLADLPAVLGFDGLDLDEPASDPTPRPRIAHLPVRPRARSVSSSSFAAPPISEPAISPPFASLDPAELAAELSGLVSASSSRSGSAAVASARVESTEVVSAPVESPRTEVVSAVDSMADGAAVGDASAGD